MISLFHTHDPSLLAVASVILMLNGRAVRQTDVPVSKPESGSESSTAKFIVPTSEGPFGRDSKSIQAPNALVAIANEYEKSAH